MKKISLLCLLLLIACSKAPYVTSGSMHRGDLPEQSDDTSFHVSKSGFSIQSLARYHIRARVHAVENYSDFGSVLAPRDAVLGWGPFEEKDYFHKNNISVSQSGRFYSWYADSFDKISRATIEQHSANVHLIPADERMASAIKELREGDNVEMTGYLVNITNPQGFHWTSSLSRNDTGNGACELFYVQRIFHVH